MSVRSGLRAVRRLTALAAAAVLASALAAATAPQAVAAPGPSFTNPLVGAPNSADPSIVHSGGNWYYVATTWSSKIVMCGVRRSWWSTAFPPSAAVGVLGDSSGPARA